MTDHLPASSPLDPTPALAQDPTPDGSTSPAIPKKHDKVRSAWIAFAGRVVAQLVGAVATVILGYTVVSHTARTAATVATAKAESDVAARVAPPANEVGAPTLVRVQRAPGPALVVLPFADYSSTAGSTPAADGLTEAVTAALARSGRVHVTSRTSAMQYRQSARHLPAIAAELGVDLVLEGSIVRQGNRARVTVQLIDAETDVHLWAQVYDRVARDVLAFEADISAAIDRDLAGVLPRGLQAPVPPAAAEASDVPVRSRAARTTF
jgi:TolB-like protein